MLEKGRSPSAAVQTANAVMRLRDERIRQGFIAVVPAPAPAAQT